MDITPPKKPTEAMRQQRDRSAHRRAYLDTYAKSRVHVDTAGRPQKTQQVVETQTQTPLQQPALQLSPQQANSTSATPIDDISFEDMAALWSAPQQQAISVSPQAQQPAASVIATPATPKQNRFSELKQTLKASQQAKKQERALQKQQQAQLKKAQQQENEQAYFAALAQREQYANESQIHAAATEQYTSADTLLDESGEFAMSGEQSTADEQKVEANLRALYAGPLSQQIAASSENSASASHMRTIVASAFACGIMAVGIFTVFGNYGSQPVVAQPIGSPVIEVEAATPQPQSGTPVANNNKVGNDIIPADPSHPVRIIMSSIGVNAPVQGLGTTPEGLMAVPKSYGVVGWYNKGAVPGQPGPAVLAGHYTGGNKGVFDNLKNAENGQLITVANGRGQTFTYKITAKNEYDKDKVPMAELFKNSVDSRLEIITCSGKWQSSEYNKRLVVTAEIVR